MIPPHNCGQERLAEGNRHTEQKKFGISFEDEYDYLQHLEAPASTTSELVGLRGKNEVSNYWSGMTTKESEMSTEVNAGFFFLGREK